MQAFYAQLLASPSPDDPYLQLLTWMTTLNRTQLQALASNLDWNGWG